MVKKTLSSIKNLLTREQNEIISAAAMLMVLLLATKIAGMVFLTLVATKFGTQTGDIDLFYLASIIPETMTNIILLGAISGSIIPIFVRIKEKEGHEKFIESFSSTMNLGMLLFVFLSILVMIFSKQFVPLALELVQKDDPLTPDQIDTVVNMMRVLLIPQIILGASAFISSLLNIYHRFIVPQLAPLFFNFGRIIGVLIFVPLMDNSVWGLVWGTVLGSILHLVIQLPLWHQLKLGFKMFYVDVRDKNFIEALKLGFPRIIGLSVEEVARIADGLISFGLTAGSLTAYQYAIRLTAIPLNLFGTSYAIASFPTLSKLWGNGAKVEFELLVKKIFNQVLFLAIPVSGIFLVLRVPIVRLVYGIFGGNFTWNDTLQVSWILMFFALGISLETLRSTIFRVYYAVHDSITPLISSMFVLVFGVITGILFTNYFSHFYEYSITAITFDPSYFLSRGDGPLGVGGLALSSSLVFSLEFVFLLIMLRFKHVITDLRGLTGQFALKVMAGGVMMVIAYILAKGWEELLQTSYTIPVIILTFSTAVVSFGIYLVLCKILKVEEVDVFMRFLIRSIKRLHIFKRKQNVATDTR